MELKLSINFIKAFYCVLVVSCLKSVCSTEDISVNLQKPKEMSAFVWLQHLEERRDEAEYNHQFHLYEVLTREISATLAGKHGISERLATEEERYIMLGAVIKTRAFYKGKPDIINDFYFGYDQSDCWQRVETDKFFAGHMAVIAATDGLSWGALNPWKIYQKVEMVTEGSEVLRDLLKGYKTQGTLQEPLIGTIKQLVVDIHAESEAVRYGDLLATLYLEDWHTLISCTQHILAVIAPELYFVDICAFEFSAFDDKGWQEHKVSRFATWLRDEDEVLETDKQAFLDTVYRNPKRFCYYIRSLMKAMTPRAVLLTPENKSLFSDLPDVPFDGTRVGIEYQFFHPILRDKKGAIIPPSWSFYLTRLLENQNIVPLLVKADAKKLTKQAADFQTTVIDLHRLYFEDLYMVKLPLVEKEQRWFQTTKRGVLVAYNNYGVFLSERNVQEAAPYYKTAADQGFTPALRNYSFLLRDHKADPRQVRLYLKMAGLLGEFRAPENGFAAGLLYEPPSLEEVFQNVRFDKQPHCIKLKKLVSVKNGNLEVHFRDSDHLRSLIEEYPELKADQIYYTHDLEIQDGEEFVAQGGELSRGEFTHIMADEPLNFEGRLDLNYSVVFPKGSNWDKLDVTIKSSALGSSQSTGLSNYEEAMDLANTLETFDQRLFQTRTKEAERLFEERRRNRLEHPEDYPDLLKICPGAYLIANADIEITQIDSLCSESFLYYFAPSLREVKELKEKLPAFSSDGIFVINKLLQQSGVYSRKPLGVRKGFKVLSRRDLCLAGTFVLQEYNICFESINSMWAFSSIRTEHGSVEISSGGSLLISSIMQGMKKPYSMPINIWQAFKEFVFKRYGVAL